MTLRGCRPTFRPILELFSVTFGKFSLEGGILGGYRILSLSLYIYIYMMQFPIFPLKGVALFSTWPYFQLPITRLAAAILPCARVWGRVVAWTQEGPGPDPWTWVQSRHVLRRRPGFLGTEPGLAS